VNSICIKFVKDAAPAGLTEDKVAFDAATKAAMKNAGCRQM